jgi:metal-dependent amidase/aminoacylase/carboxypeptidase family protein
MGHACGHNLIAIASLGAGLATAEMIKKQNLSGKVIIVGTPGEEGIGGGKIRLLEAGAYEEVDISLISHPGIFNNSPRELLLSPDLKLNISDVLRTQQIVPGSA